MSVSFSLTDEEKRTLGEVAKGAIRERLEGRPAVAPDARTCTPMLRRPLGAFVTLNRRGALRGCIGFMVGREPLVRTVWRMAQAAAFEDPRFRPVRLSEWPEITMEITVLDELTPCPDPSQVVIGRHGLMLEYGGRRGVFLPQVPVEQHWDLAAYLTNLCYKAGVPDGSWKEPGARLYWYEGLVFPVQM